MANKCIEVVLLDDSRCGKTSLATCYATGEFLDFYFPTNYFDNCLLHIGIDGALVIFYNLICLSKRIREFHRLYRLLSLWHTSGKAKYDEESFSLSFSKTDIFMIDMLRIGFPKFTFEYSE